MAQTFSLHKKKAEITPSGNRSWEPLRFRSSRAIALLGYLAAEQRPISRGFLARLIWPDHSRSKGRTSLRRELYSLTKLLPDCWQLDRQAVAFFPSEEIDLDIYILLEMEAQENWLQAADLISGEFLEGLQLDNNLEFENWLSGERNRWAWRVERIFTAVIEAKILRGRYRDGLQYCQRLLQLAPWEENAHKQAMRLLTWTGQRGAALHQFETCKQVLKDELNLEPSRDTITLYKKILAGGLDLPPQRPLFLVEETAQEKVISPSVVAREREIQKLQKSLEKTLAGKGRVIFVIGDAGRGKTVLMQAFARQAMEKHSNLLVASGNCNAYSGIGDPYLPFRDLMAMLTGDVENKWDSGTITREHASRLWEAFPIVANALLAHGPNLINVLIQGSALMGRADFFELTSDAPWVVKLKKLLRHQRTRPMDYDSIHLFQETTYTLQAIARKKPLLLIIDDLQWVDEASISLLFHLGRRFSETNSKIMILCAFRPEEVFSGRGSERHPLINLLNEFKRVFNDAWVNLDQTSIQDARRFTDAILDIEPNKLRENFRSTMLEQTNGHPLFTVELLNAMRERGDLFKDKNGFWIESDNLDWNLLPAKVESVIEERIERLDPELREILTIASVEGESFTAEIVAKVQGAEERFILHTLSKGLTQQHRLVREQEGIEIRGKILSRYKFNHILFQNYFYKQLGKGERRLIHASVANAIENLYGNQLDSITVKLAQHLHLANDFPRAFRYYIQAAERAASIYAINEAITNYSQAIDLISKLSPDAITQANLYRERGCIYERLGKFDLALSDLETALDFAEDVEDRFVKWRQLIDLGKLWASRDYHKTKEYFLAALKLARNLGQPKFIAKSLNWVGNFYTNADEPQKAFWYHHEALTTLENLNIPQEMAKTLDLLGVSHLMGGNLRDSIQYYDRAINYFYELNNRFHLVSSLIGRAATFSMLAFLASVPCTSLSKAISDLTKAIRIAGDISSFSGEAWAYWSLGMLHIVEGQFGKAINVLQRGLEIAMDRKHKEFVAGFWFALGFLYIEVFESSQALAYLEKSLPMAKELDAHTHILLSCGTLVGAHLAQGDIDLAQKCLDDLISAQTPMNTLGKRYCWVRQAEIALSKRDPKRALELLDRLIATAPGIRPDDVITYLWMLKGEAFNSLELFDEAIAFTESAVTNAQKIGERFLLWRAHANLGQYYLAMGQPSAAKQQFLTSRSIVEDIATTIPDDCMKRNFLRGAFNLLGCDL